MGGARSPGRAGLRPVGGGDRVAAVRWEVHYDPYDVSRIWVRNHRDGGWITALWKHRAMLTQPFADFTWRHARKVAAARGVDTTNETAVAVVLEGLLRRAGAGPGDQRVLARAAAAIELQAHIPAALLPGEPPPPISADSPTSSEPEAVEDAGQADELEDEQGQVLEGTVVGFGLFDPFADERGGRA